MAQTHHKTQHSTPHKTMKVINLLISSIALSLLLLALTIPLASGAGEQCGWQANNKTCANDLCCSRAGYCGTTDPYCGEGCQSNCDQGGGGDGGDDPDDPTNYLSDIFDKAMFEEFLLHRNDVACPARNFYKYINFIEAAKKYPAFAKTGDEETRKREIAAFFGQTSHETTGGWPDAPDGPYAWGYCFKKEVGCEQFPGGTFCDPNWPCNTSFVYCGRGPIQLTWNYNYYQCGQGIGLDLINNPELVSTDGEITFEAALWFWMTPQSPKPSAHDVIVGKWVPTENDLSKGRVPGYGVIINIINGGLECNIPDPDSRVEDRIGFYKRYCELLGIDPGQNLDCYHQRPFNDGLKLQSM